MRLYIRLKVRAETRTVTLNLVRVGETWWVKFPDSDEWHTAQIPGSPERLLAASILDIAFRLGLDPNLPAARITFTGEAADVLRKAVKAVRHGDFPTLNSAIKELNELAPGGAFLRTARLGRGAEIDRVLLQLTKRLRGGPTPELPIGREFAAIPRGGKPWRRPAADGPWPFVEFLRRGDSYVLRIPFVERWRGWRVLEGPADAPLWTLFKIAIAKGLRRHERAFLTVPKPAADLLRRAASADPETEEGLTLLVRISEHLPALTLESKLMPASSQ